MGVFCAQDARAAHVMLTGNATRLKAALQDVEDNADANTSRFSKEVTAAIPRLRGCVVFAPLRSYLEVFVAPGFLEFFHGTPLNWVVVHG